MGLALLVPLFYLVAGNKLRSSSRLALLIGLAGLVFGVALSFRSSGRPKFSHYDSVVAPLVFLIGYAGTRYVFKLRYGMEPTWNLYGKFVPEDRRDRTWWDALVIAIPAALAILGPFILHRVLG